VLALEGRIRHVARDVDRKKQTLGAAEYNITEAAQESRKGRIKGTRELRQTFYLRELATHFGPEAAADPALRLVALCGRAPLAEERYQRLFRIDWFGRTIAHESGFAEEFADKTGGHSECVARRIARDLWEMHKAEHAGGAERLLQRPDELVEHVDSLMAYKIPCPEALERELARRLRTRRPQPIYEAWRRQHEAPTGGRSAIEEEFRALEEEYGEAIGRELMGSYRENPKRWSAAMGFVPTPVHTMAARRVW
jgi:hypothetical protein